MEVNQNQLWNHNECEITYSFGKIMFTLHGENHEGKKLEQLQNSPY